MNVVLDNVTFSRLKNIESQTVMHLNVATCFGFYKNLLKKMSGPVKELNHCTKVSRDSSFLFLPNQFLSPGADTQGCSFSPEMLWPYARLRWTWVCVFPLKTSAQAVSHGVWCLRLALL